MAPDGIEPVRSELALIILAVADVARAAEFYRTGFGCRQLVAEAVYAEFELASGLRLGLYERAAFGRNTGVVPAPAPAGSVCGTELYFRVDDVHAAVRVVEQAGARELASPALRDWGDEVGYLADPDGNVIALARPANRDVPAGQVL